MKILLFDGFSIMNRAFYALPLLTNSSGEYTNAVFGFMNIFFRFMDEEKPDCVAVAWDLPAPTFRHEMYGAYKGTRKSMPDELRAQVPALKQLLETMGVVAAACEGYEADDVLGTMAIKAAAQGFTSVIITGDRDMLQLASDKIKIRLPKTKAGKTEVEDYDDAAVLARYGVTPTAYIDVKALMGDASDNIPGVPSIGEVTATKIIAAYGSVENAIANAAEIKPKKASENLQTFHEQAILSKKLATIVIDAPIEINLSQNTTNLFNDESRAKVRQLELKSLYKKFGATAAGATNAAGMTTTGGNTAARGSAADAAHHNEASPSANATHHNETHISTNAAPNTASNNATQSHEIRNASPCNFEICKTQAEAEKFFASLTTQNTSAAFFPLWSEDAFDESILVGLAVAAENTSDSSVSANAENINDAKPAVDEKNTDENTSANALIKYFHIGGELTLGNSQASDLTEAALLTAAKPWLESPTPKFVYDLKTHTRRLARYGISPQNITFDAMLAAYILDATSKNDDHTDIALHYLYEETPTLEEILDNKGKRTAARRTVAALPEATAAHFAATAACTIARARPIMEQQLEATGQTALFREMELPLAVLLADMEATGIQVDRDTLQKFGEEAQHRITALTALIYDMAGEEFNINSPQQLGEILFTKLGLKGGKKTTKGYSTAADVLEKIVHTHAIVPLILEYRASAKLKSTYVDGMLPLIKPDTSRIHSTFHQALTATGRLSSAEPNLQNIPVRTPLGRELRKAFVPAAGCVFLDADYSQIELRLLAHISGDEVLIKAFNENQDIHRLTASQVLDIPPADVTPDERNRAKAVNFGIIYGISSFGLSEDLKISVKEADAYIKGFYEKYPGVKKYLDETVATAKENGFVATLYNRRRAMPELRSPNFNTRSFGQRVAMNMPIQGTAADIIKLAMLRVDTRLRTEGLRGRIILQVHDELLLEVPHEEKAQVAHILEEMTQVAELQVPLVADVNVGDSWYATK